MSNLAIQNVVMFGSMFAIIYLMILRPQQREKKKHEEAVMAIKKGDELVTAGGLVGEVVHVKTMGTDGAPTLADRVTIRSGESRVVVERGRIARVASSAGAAAAPAAPASKTAGSSTAG
jgi:preprotein translocase subunit YajC